MEQLAERPDNVPPERVVDFDVYYADWLETSYHEYFGQLQSNRKLGLVWTPRNEGHWIATRGELIWEILPDHEHFSNHLVIVPRSIGEQDRRIPSTLDPPEHQPIRALMDAGLGPKSIRQIEPLIRQLAIDLIESFARDGHCDFNRQYAQILPIQVFLGLVDLPLSDVDELKYWCGQIVHPDGENSFETASQWFRDYLGPVIERRRGGDGTDLFSIMINGNVHGRPLDREEMYNLCLQALLGGLDTVVNFMGFMMLGLAQNAEVRSRLAADSAMIPKAVEELLRRYSVVNVARVVRGDMQCEGVELKQGDIVMLPTSLVGTDEKLNKCPFTVDLDRKRPRHAAFGRGPHFCPGVHLARAEIRVTLEEWLRRIPEFSLAPDAEPKFRSGIVGTVRGVSLVW